MLDAHLANSISAEDKIRQWWRQKAWLFNFVVGFVGIAIVTIEYHLLNRRIEWIFLMLPLIVVFGIAANVGYYMGIIIELFIKESYPKLHQPNTNKIIFWAGTLLLCAMMINVEIKILVKHFF